MWHQSQSRPSSCFRMNPSSGMAVGFGGLFAAIAASWASAAEQRWLRRCAVESGATAVVRYSTAPPEAMIVKSDDATFLALDMVLAEVADKAKMPLTPCVSVAKAWLREQGEHGRILAGRLGRLSRRRNGAAHPDGALQRDIRALGTAGDLGELSSSPSTAAVSPAGLDSADSDAEARVQDSDFPELVVEVKAQDSELPEVFDGFGSNVGEVLQSGPISIQPSASAMAFSPRASAAARCFATKVGWPSGRRRRSGASASCGEGDADDVGPYAFCREVGCKLVPELTRAVVCHPAAVGCPEHVAEAIVAASQESPPRQAPWLEELRVVLHGP